MGSVVPLSGRGAPAGSDKPYSLTPGKAYDRFGLDTHLRLMYLSIGRLHQSPDLSDVALDDYRIRRGDRLEPLIIGFRYSAAFRDDSFFRDPLTPLVKAGVLTDVKDAHDVRRDEGIPWVALWTPVPLGNGLNAVVDLLLYKRGNAKPNIPYLGEGLYCARNAGLAKH